MRPEDHLAQQIASYLNTQYPKIIYHFDTGSGGRTSIGMAMRNKRLNRWRGYPDLFICKSIGLWLGLFIELKTSTPYKKDGQIKTDEHLIEQQTIHTKMKSEGYRAEFGIGFEGCKKIIDDYLLNKN